MNLLLGIGNPRHGDDALGPVLARAFRHPAWHTVNACTAPENFTGLVRRLHPRWLVLLDAAEMSLPPGCLRRLPPETIESGDFGTHAGSIGQLARYLSDCADAVTIVGIQPASTTPGARLCKPVRAALRTLAAALAAANTPADLHAIPICSAPHPAPEPCRPSPGLDPPPTSGCFR